MLISRAFEFTDVEKTLMPFWRKNAGWPIRECSNKLIDNNFKELLNEKIVENQDIKNILSEAKEKSMQHNSKLPPKAITHNEHQL